MKRPNRLVLEEQLRAAIHERRIRAHFQPKFDGNGTVAGVEAPARWYADNGSPIAPGTFIPLAEETGLIVPLGELMLREACELLRHWRDNGISCGRVAVNISMIQMRDPAFADGVLRCLAEYAVSGDHLELELTESVFAEDTNAIAAQLTRLVDAGVHIAIDDFGTGFSSMSVLRHFPIHALKIDRSFIVDCTRSKESRLLLKALIDIGHALQLEVVAEGVENNAHMDVLRELRCDVFQGYLFAPALSAQQLETFLGDQRPTSRLPLQRLHG